MPLLAWLDDGPYTRGMTSRGAYIHVPFCRRRCGYCNFTLVAGRDDLLSDYLAALARELEMLGRPRPVQTLYVGGGTPTHLPPPLLAELCGLLARWFPLEADYEYTVEANPEDIDTARLDVLSAAGVNRLSLGVQSLSAPKLAALERQHTPEEAARGWELACQRFEHVSLDMIFAAPGETLAQWQSDLEAALALSPRHVSTYGLTYEQGTNFFARRTRGELVESDENLQREMYLASIERITAAGLAHYEISSFAAYGHKSRHNRLYWSGGEYYAAGPGAARHLDGVRETNHRSTTTYIRRLLADESPVAEREELAPDDRARERLVFGLRQLEGIDLGEFQQQTGFAPDELGGAALEKFIALGLLERSGPRLRLTREGLLVSDSLWPELITA